MIIDIILDRRDDEATYKPLEDLRRMFIYALHFEFCDLAKALDSGTEADVKRELCRYIEREGYDPLLKEYINSVEWIESYDKAMQVMRQYCSDCLESQ